MAAVINSILARVNSKRVDSICFCFSFLGIVVTTPTSSRRFREFTVMEFRRWTVADLSARYELEPQLRDVFVEDMFDLEVLKRVMDKFAITNTVVYEIDVVDISYDVFHKYDLTDGNKQWLIALSLELEYHGSDISFKCLVDKDLDHWFGNLREERRLVWTQFTSM